MDERLASLLDYAAKLQAKYDYPSTPVAFARAAGIRLIPADNDSANAGPPSYITYDARFGLNPRRFTLWHEIAHVLMGWHGIDDDACYWLGEMESELFREQTANLLAGQLMVPRQLFQKAIREYGFTPEMLLILEQQTGMSSGVCLRRAIFDDLEASRAGVVLVASQVLDVVTHNYRLPFYRYERIPEPNLVLEEARLMSVGRSRVIALWEG